MATTYTYDPTEDPTTAELERATSAYEQGEALLNAQQEDRDRRFQQVNAEQEDVGLIGGKFKNQEDLLKAYKELERKLGTKTPEDGEEGLTEAPEGLSEPSTDEEPPESSFKDVVNLMQEAGKAYDSGEGLPEEAIDKLSEMDSKDLIKAYMEYIQQSRQQGQVQQLQESQLNDIYTIAGGKDKYAEVVTWAAQNLDQGEIDAYNSVTNSGNPAAIRFAVEALTGKYRLAEGNEAPLITGRKAASSGGAKPYRSQAELVRDISNPKYDKDPAYRSDVEARLAVSNDLF